ncbi:unnamed protein product, partial [Effrenium voratum]
MKPTAKQLHSATPRAVLYMAGRLGRKFLAALVLGLGLRGLAYSTLAGTVSRHELGLERGARATAFAGPSMDSREGQAILILGGGVIGVSISYHLALRGIKTVVVDRAGIASCASGKAGGFLARSWNSGTPTDALSQKSFDMHEEVAKRLSLSSYRRLKCQSVAVDGTGSKPAGAKLKNLEWTDLGVRGSRLMGDESTIAQVHPKELCDAMWSYSEQQGSKLVKGVVEKLCYADREGERTISGVIVDGELLSADAVVLCMGPWGDVLQQAVP